MAPTSPGQARPAVLALGLQALVELDLRRAQVRRVARRVAPHADERTGLFGACRQNAARPVIFEGAAEEVHAVCEQRGGERVACKPVEHLAVERETSAAVRDR